MLQTGTWRGRGAAALAVVGVALAALIVQTQPSFAARPLHAGAVYTATNSPAGNEIVAFHRDAAGQLSPAGSFTTGGQGTGADLGSQGSVVLSDNGRYLVAVNAGSDDVSLFAVGHDGLELLDVEPAQGSTPISVTISGRTVYVVNDGSDSIAGFRIERDGLEPIPGSVQPLGAGAAPGQISFTPQGRSLVVTVKNTNQILVFSVAKDGSASAPEVSSSASGTPFGFAIDRHGRAFVSEAAVSALSSYEIDGGSATLITGPVLTNQAAACWVVLSNDGRFAFTANAGSNSISSFAIAGDGSVSLAASVAAATGPHPVDMGVSHDGKFLYGFNRDDGSISGFRVGHDGTLTPVGGAGGLSTGGFGLAVR